MGKAGSHVRKGSGTAIVHVRLDGGHRAREKVSLHGWYSGPWFGAARLDGVRGGELVLGHVAGAHTAFFRVLTYRSGRLVRERPPGGGSRWTGDGSYSSDISVYRGWHDGHAYVTTRTAERSASGHGHHGRDTRCRWNRGWHEVSSTRRHYAEDSAAFRVGGWHVAGLDRFP